MLSAVPGMFSFCQVMCGCWTAKVKMEWMCFGYPVTENCHYLRFLAHLEYCFYQKGKINASLPLPFNIIVSFDCFDFSLSVNMDSRIFIYPLGLICDSCYF